MTHLPPDSEYVTIKDGHLSLDGRRIRFWGAVCAHAGKTHADNEAAASRLADLGYNMVRFWPGFPYGESYAKGDGSPQDLADHFIACLKRRGIRIWCAGLNAVGDVRPEDVAAVDDPATAADWQAAVAQRAAEQGPSHIHSRPGGARLRGLLARIWDRRLHTLGIERMRTVAGHLNLYTGLRWADDPVMAVWELSNEEWWFRHMMGGRFLALPRHFQLDLLRQWNEFLRARYVSDESLSRAWGRLLEGESLAAGSVLLLPLKADVLAEKQCVALGVDIPATIRQSYGPDDFVAARGSDVIDFLMGLWLTHKRREHEAMKACGKSIAMAPLCWDTGIGYEMQSQYLHQQADAVAHCTYITGFHHDPTHKRFPWFSGLEELPRLCWDKPWVECGRTPGKPFLVYETQIHNPAKYRAEYPMRIAALGAIQDWDAVIWHQFAREFPAAGERAPYSRAMNYTSSASGYPKGLELEYDEVQASATRAAGAVFLGGLLSAADRPTTFIFGRHSLRDMRMIEYGPAGERFLPTTWRHGSRIVIDPQRDDDQIIGPSLRPRAYEPCPIRPTGQIELDWQRGHLMFDAPGVAMYCGFLARFGREVRFANGVVLRDVTVANPAGMPYPVGRDELYICFCVASTDGRPLDQCASAVLSLVSTSFNSGFKLDESKLRQEFLWHANPGATVSDGGEPVLVARVGATVQLPMRPGGRYRMLDWHMNQLAAGTLAGELRLDESVPVFAVELGG